MYSNHKLHRSCLSSEKKGEAWWDGLQQTNEPDVDKNIKPLDGL